MILFVNSLQSCICVHEQILHNVHDTDFPLLIMRSTCSETVRLCLLYPKDRSKKLVSNTNHCRITLCGINNNRLRQWCVHSITLCLCYNLASLSSTESAANQSLICCNLASLSWVDSAAIRSRLCCRHDSLCWVV